MTAHMTAASPARAASIDDESGVLPIAHARRAWRAWKRHRAIALARRWMKPGRAVIVDTETTDLDGRIIEVAVMDAATGTIIFSSLVNSPDPIEPTAQRIHGICDEDCEGAPTWLELWPVLRSVIGNRVVLAYNAPYDDGRVQHECALLGMKAMPALKWRCVMRLNSDFTGSRKWARLDGGHRAEADTLATRRVLQRIATGAEA